MFDKLTDIAIMMIFTFVVIVILYLTYTYIWPWFISWVAHDEIVAVIQQTVKAECLK